MWILLSLVSGLSDALRDSVVKGLSRSTPQVMIAWSYSLCSLPYFLPFVLLQPPVDLSADFWLLALFLGATHVLGSLGVTYALASSDLSLCVPMVAFTPVFLVVVGPLITGHIPSAHGVAGTLLVALGCYLLNIRDATRGGLAPIRAIFREKGVRMMLLVSLLWSVTSAIDLRAVRTYGLAFWSAAELAAIAALFVPVVIARRGMAATSPASWRGLALIGVLNAFSFGPYLVALSSSHALYVVCVKRSSILFSLVLGRILFNENSLHGRLLGASLMFLGVCVISIWG